MLGIVAIVVGMALVAITLVALPGLATSFEATVTTSSSSSLEHEVVVGSVGITLGRAVLHPNERVTLFYVARNTAEELDGAVMIDNAEVESSDGRSWLADGHGVVLERPPLTLGWLTFPVSDAAPGSFKVTVNSVQADGNHVRGAWQLPKLPGLEARSDVLKPIVIDSDLCVSTAVWHLAFMIGPAPRSSLTPNPFVKVEVHPKLPALRHGRRLLPRTLPLSRLRFVLLR